MKKYVLITGVAGLIGSRMADWILENKPEYGVIGVDNLFGGYIDNVDDRVIFYQRDLSEEKINDIFEQYPIEYVYHFTCYDVVQKQVLPAEYRNTKINVYGNSNSFMLTSFALWKQLNGFDEKYKSNFFDIDYSIKALLNGKNSYNITGAVCWYHKAIKSKYAKRDENRISKRIKEYLTIIDETSKKE